MKKINKDIALFYILLTIIIIETIIILFKNFDNCDIKPYNVCSMAYNCKVDDNNPEIMICDYSDNDNKIKKTKCPNFFCENAYACIENEENPNVLDCKYTSNNEEKNIKCPKGDINND